MRPVRGASRKAASAAVTVPVIALFILPLFGFAQQAAADQQERALVDRVVSALLKRMGG